MGTSAQGKEIDIESSGVQHFFVQKHFYSWLVGKAEISRERSVPLLMEVQTEGLQIATGCNLENCSIEHLHK